MKIVYSFWFSLFCILLFNTTLGHYIEDNTLKQVEILSKLQYDIAPRSSHFLEKRYNPLDSSLKKTIQYDDHIRLILRAYNQTFYLHLKPNLDIFHPNAVIIQKGNTPLNPQNFKVYRGHVIDPEKSLERWRKEKAGTPEEKLSRNEVMGWARVIVTDSSRHSDPIIEGAFQVYDEQYHIKTTHNYNISKRSFDTSIDTQDDDSMIIYKDSDISANRNKHISQCGFDRLNLPPIQDMSPFLDGSEKSFNAVLDSQYHSNKNTLFKRSRVTQGCPTVKKINYMGAAADCTYVRHYGDTNRARLQIINNFNMVSALFEETFNVAIGLINITIMDSNCPPDIDESKPWNRACDVEYPLNDRLSDFSLWRSKMADDGAGLWHLMTNCPSGMEVGMAWLKQLCNSGSQTQFTEDGKIQHVSGAGVSSITLDEWKIVAHEIGHGFGAIHDCTKDNCPCSGDNCNCCQLSQDQCDAGGNFMMNPASNSTATDFSPCSINTICNAFPSTATCLSDVEEQKHDIYKLNVCGNGVLEEGEECDTGGKDSDCCDPKTCKFINNAVCEDSNSSCCHKCQFREKSHICRPASTLCDIPEYCTGDSPTCPTDTFIKDGTICGSNGLKCASGQCTSRNEQCLSRGSGLNITRSCLTNNEECKILCNAPGNSEKCVLISGFFINGTPCGFNGYCMDGVCKDGDAISSGMIWIEENKAVTIPGAILIIFNVFIFLYIIFRLGCRSYLWKKIHFRRKFSYHSLPDYISSHNDMRDLSIVNKNQPGLLSAGENNFLYVDRERDGWNSRISFDSTVGETSSSYSSNSTVVEDVYIHSDSVHKL